MTRSIALTRRFSTVVDDDLFEELNKVKWLALSNGNSVYAARHRPAGEAGSRWIRMHREIADPEEQQDVDHINGNTLDNRRCNLRPATRGQNNVNRLQPTTAGSGFRGVYRIRRKGCQTRWLARLHLNGKQIYLGKFPDPEQAARVRDRAALEAWGEFAKLNFPNDVAS